jgi:hypothetical protein
MRREQRTASMVGLRVPAANGAMVMGTRPTQTSLVHIVSVTPYHPWYQRRKHAPLECPVVATVRRMRRRDGCRIVHWVETG